MLPLTVKLLVALACFTAVYLSTEAADHDTCRATTASCIPRLPGRDGRDGQAGRYGATGTQGRDGLQGPPGMNGINGAQGPPGLPGALNYTEQQHMCRSSHTSAGCTSVTFPSIEGYYVDGLSVTHGRPRNHIWTFAAGVSKDYNHGISGCLCSAPYPGAAAPPFVGEQFFCEPGSTGTYSLQWYLEDPLWDSQGCANGSTCCSRGGPWFSSAMSKATSDDIEVRWCSSYDTDGEDTGVDQLEIYVN